jgi:hypothetical protein
VGDGKRWATIDKTWVTATDAEPGPSSDACAQNAATRSGGIGEGDSREPTISPTRHRLTWTGIRRYRRPDDDHRFRRGGHRAVRRTRAGSAHTSAANPAPISLTGWPRPIPRSSAGRADNVSLTLLDANGCQVELGAGVLGGGGPGFTGIAYRSTDARVSFAAAGKGLFVQSVTAQCNAATEAGLEMRVGDRISLGGFGDSIADSSAIISPAQTISSP